jgi:hypothetical protein
MNILDLVVGKPIKTSDERAEQIGPTQGIPIFGLDALSSAAYGPEAALSLLIPLGLLGVGYIVPISAAIITLLVIVYFSYRQTIAAYPSGGGSYTVARFNLGARAGLLAAAALLADYILTAQWAFPQELVLWSRPFLPYCRTPFLFPWGFWSSLPSLISAACGKLALLSRFPPIFLSAHFS